MARLRKMMSGCIVFILILCSLTACGYKSFEDKLRRGIDKIGETEADTDEIVQLDEKEFISWEEYHGESYKVVYTIKKAVYYESVEAAGLSKEDIVSIPMECIADLLKDDGGWDNVKPDCGFIMFDVEVYNVNYPGDAMDGSINVAGLGLMDETRDKDDVTYGGIGLGYFDKHPKGELATETNYYHLFLKIGEKTDVKVGMLVAASDIEAARKYSLNTPDFKKYDLSDILEEGDSE